MLHHHLGVSLVDQVIDVGHEELRVLCATLLVLVANCLADATDLAKGGRRGGERGWEGVEGAVDAREVAATGERKRNRRCSARF